MNSGKTVTLKDIAAAIGVSTMAVSTALNNRGRLSPEMRFCRTAFSAISSPVLKKSRRNATSRFCWNIRRSMKGGWRKCFRVFPSIMWTE